VRGWCAEHGCHALTPSRLSTLAPIRRNALPLLACLHTFLPLPSSVPAVPSHPSCAALPCPALRCAGYDLLRYASAVHMLHPPPDALLVDDLQALSELPLPHGASDRPRPRDMALCRILAALREAAVRCGAAWCGGGAV